MLIDKWIKTKVGLKEADKLTRKKLEDYQLFQVQETIAFAKKNSPFYSNHLAHINPKEDIQSLKDLEKIPFTTPKILIEQGEQMLCVPSRDISRITTMETAGSTASPKRIFFTEKDQQLTLDYFNYGMRVMTTPQDIFLILLPNQAIGSVGDILKKALERNGTKVIPYGYPNPDESQDEEIITLIENKKVTSLVGNPSIVARLAQKSKGKDIHLKTALLTADYVSPEDVHLVEANWNCRTFEHYGMTETGFGGAMACNCHRGYHPREADLLYEIIDSNTEEPLTESRWGQLVFTTLTREGMPLIRYKTGDTSRWLPEVCSCGSILKRFDRVQDRGIRKKIVASSQYPTTI